VTLAAQTMSRRLTVPFARGADSATLALLPGASPSDAIVAPSDFVAEHHAMFDATPDPRYVVALADDVDAAVTVTASHGGGTSAPLVFPAASRAGQSRVLDLGPHAPPGPTLTQLRASGLPHGTSTDRLFRLTALLGNTGKLLWVLGCERDTIRRELERTVAQRQRGAGVGRGLDLLGYDLGISRFVPLPYSYDTSTLLLLHLDDVPALGQPEVSTAADARALYVSPASTHDAANSGASSGAQGRFGRAFGFASANAVLSVADHADFALAVTADTTVECFVKPASAADGQLLSKHPDPRIAAPGPAGWALSVGDFGRGLPRNVRFLLCDGTNRIELYADDSLTEDAFHHVAGVLDRAAGEARLIVDGRLRAVVRLGALGALTNSQPVRVGAAGGPAVVASVDEVRISGVARTGFAPVLGESDDSYRRRLTIFQRWTLPTPANIQSALNESVGAIGGMTHPLIVDDTPSTLVSASTTIELEPGDVPVGVHIDALGGRRSTEPEVCGSVDEESDEFRTRFLLEHPDPRASYAPPPARVLSPGEPAPDPGQMQPATARKLTALLDLLVARGVAGALSVVSGFDPRAGDLRAIGRGLLLRHSAVSNARLASLAHAAGFAWVENRLRDGAAYVSVPRDEYLEISGGTPGPTGDVAVSSTLALKAGPDLGSGARWQWLIVPCGAGRGHFAPAPTAATANLVADAPGMLTVRVEARGSNWRASGTRTIRVAPSALADGQSIASDGTLGAGPPAAPDQELDFFHPVYLLTTDLPIGYASDDARRLQAGTAEALGLLTQLLAVQAPGGTLTVTEGWVRAANDLRGRGRELTITHSSLDPGRLGALAWDAGFVQVWRDGPRIHARGAQTELLTLTSPPQLAEGTSSSITFGPRAAPQAVAAAGSAIVTADLGSDSISILDPATGRVSDAIKVGRQPCAVALTPTGARAFTADRASGVVSAIDLTTRSVVAQVTIPAGASALVLRSQQLFVLCRDAARVVVIDTSTMNVTSTVACRSGAASIAVAADASSVWVTAAADKLVQVFKVGPPLSLAAEVAVPGTPAGVGLLDTSDRAYVALQDTGRVQLLAMSTRALVSDFAAGSHPIGVAASASQQRVLVLDPAAGHEQLLSFTPTGQPRGVARLPDGSTAVATADGRAYVTGLSRDHIAAVDISTTALDVAAVWRLGSGLGESFTWVIRPLGSAAARVAAPTTPVTTLFADRAGRIALRAVLSLDDHEDPYTFEVRLRPELDVPGTTISKEQYDLLMNVLNLLHPIGVEVRTRSIREHVPEVRAGQLDAFPAYTYPDFRVRGPAPTRPDRS
jgi:YVTN family beta-propeller protein